jgi:hypothetical protein
MDSLNKLYDYLFHYNSFESTWYAFKRDEKEKYFNGELDKDTILKARNIKVLLDVISKDIDIK